MVWEIERLKMPGGPGGGSVGTQFFGKCVDREVNITGGTAMKRLAATSSFMFVAEEEICDDFVSEGFYRALNLSYIPVVFGGRDVGFDEVALAGTYVDAFDFDDGREIVQFLGELLRDDSKDWVQLMSWQHDFVVVPPTPWVCGLATAVADASDVSRLGDEHLKVIEDFREFWHSKKCYGSYREARDALV